VNDAGKAADDDVRSGGHRHPKIAAGLFHASVIHPPFGLCGEVGCAGASRDNEYVGSCKVVSRTAGCQFERQRAVRRHRRRLRTIGVALFAGSDLYRTSHAKELIVT
jgi:hypothetical protein